MCRESYDDADYADSDKNDDDPIHIVSSINRLWFSLYCVAVSGHSTMQNSRSSLYVCVLVAFERKRIFVIQCQSY